MENIESSAQSTKGHRKPRFSLARRLTGALLAAVMLPSLVFALAAQQIAPPQASGVRPVYDSYDFISIVFQWLMVSAVSVGTIFIIWGAVQYKTGRDDRDKKWRAKQKIVGGLISIALAFLAFMLWGILPYPPFGAGPLVS